MEIDRRAARYPFLADAREAVQSAGVTLEGLVERDAPAVERGRERVERALLEGTTAPATPGRWDPVDELLSYPIARILVSLLDVRAAVEKYATAEAATARERVDEDLDRESSDLRSVERPTLTLDVLLREFDLDGSVRREPGADGPAGTGPAGGPASRPDRSGRGAREDRFRVAVADYLRLSTREWGDEWRLAVRELADGEVRVTETELRRLLQAAVRERVADGLPFEVRSSAAGETIADALVDEVAALRSLLSDREPDPPTGVLRPELFPPCVAGLLDRARAEDGDLSTESAFTLQAFLTDLGVDAEAIGTLLGADGEAADLVATRAGYLADGDRSQYPAPSCATVQAYGDCPGPDERCETITSPLGYYAAAATEAGVDPADGDPGAGTGTGTGAGTSADGDGGPDDAA